MALSWTKSWSSSDDGSVLSGSDLDNIQNDIDAQAVLLAGTQTITGNKTMSGTNTHSGNCTLSGTNTHSGNCTFSGNNTFSGTNSFSATSTFTGLITSTGGGVIARLSTTVVDMKTAQANTLYTVPAGKTAIITHVIVRSPTATLAGGTDYDFTNWRQTVSLATMTATTDFMVITGADVTKYTMPAATTTFQMTVSTGSTGAANATVDVFGYLF